MKHWTLYRIRELRCKNIKEIRLHFSRRAWKKLCLRYVKDYMVIQMKQFYRRF